MSTTKKTAQPSSAPLSFQQQVLTEHNLYRAKHSAPPLKLNSALSRHAQIWANNLAAENKLVRANTRFSQNLQHSFGIPNFDGTYPVKCWYNQSKDYKFGQPSPEPNVKVGSFTQIVWKESRELGVGLAKNGTNNFVVCYYDPPGNVDGKYALNVTGN